MRSLSALICILILTPLLTHTTYRITFTIRYYPALDQILNSDNIQLSSKDPSRAIQTILRTQVPSTGASGIIVTYAGFTTMSSIEGQVNLPRKQQNPSFNLLISLDFEPIMMAGVTVFNWQLLPDADARMYNITLEQDPETHLFFWNVQQTALPADNMIPLNTIVIAAKPHNIYIPEGITLTKNAPNLILPDIYAKKGSDFWTDSLNFLQVKHFFRTIKTLEQQYSQTYWATQLKP